jgi:hypothetical protein
MYKQFLFLTCFILILVTPAFCGKTDSTAFPGREEKPYRLTVAYWNDDFLLEKQINSSTHTDIFLAGDDRFTANGWLQYRSGDSTGIWQAEVIYNIVTDRKSNIRTDLLTLRWGTIMRTELADLQWFSGVTLNGKQGGEAIQNGFHELFGYDRIAMNYRNGYLVDVHLSLELVRTIWQNRGLMLQSRIGGFLATIRMPSSYWIASSIVYTPKEAPSFQAEMNLRYFQYLQRDETLPPMFGTGFAWGFRASKHLSSTAAISFWMVGNPYGLPAEKNFGISVSVGSIGLLPPLDEMRFP